MEKDSLYGIALIKISNNKFNEDSELRILLEKILENKQIIKKIIENAELSEEKNIPTIEIDNITNIISNEPILLIIKNILIEKNHTYNTDFSITLDNLNHLKKLSNFYIGKRNDFINNKKVLNQNTTNAPTSEEVEAPAENNSQPTTVGSGQSQGK